MPDISPDRLAGQLAAAETGNATLHNLYVLHGTEALQQQEAQDAIRSAARAAGYTERSVFTVQGSRFDWSQVLGAAGSMGLFADRQILEIRLPTGKPGKEGAQALQSLAQMAHHEQQSGDAATLFIVSLNISDYSTRKTAWFKALTQSAVTVSIQDIPPAALPRWIAQRLRAQGHTVADSEEGQHALRCFAQYVEGNLLAAHQAIEKLALTRPPGILSLDDIVASTSNMARFNTADISEVVLSGQVTRCQHMLSGLQQTGEQPHGAHWILSSDISNLLRIRTAMDAGDPLPAAMQSVRAWGSRQRLYERAVPRLSAAYMRHMLAGAHIVDGITKGIGHPDWPGDSWQAFRRLALTLTQKLVHTGR